MSSDIRFMKRHNEDDFVDEVRIVTRERWKTSELSGDEWRFHRVIQFYRKGCLLWERAFNGDIGRVSAWVAWMLVEASESGALARPDDDDHKCFQPGCAEDAVCEYEIIETFGPQGQRLHPDEQRFSRRRRFCEKHMRRGDCDREDADDNYRSVPYVKPLVPQPAA